MLKIPLTLILKPSIDKKPQVHPLYQSAKVFITQPTDELSPRLFTQNVHYVVPESELPVFSHACKHLFLRIYVNFMHM